MKKIPLHGKHGSGKFALVDDDDYPIVSPFKWYVAVISGLSRCMTCVKIDDEWVYLSMSRLIMSAKKGEVVDHENHDTLDNRKQNLRTCTNQQNNMNCKKRIKKTSSKYKGVCWDKKNNKWSANISFNSKKTTIGRFHEEKAAAQAYDIMARKLHGEFAYYNNVGVLPNGGMK